jgi:hypothetical protein
VTVKESQAFADPRQYKYKAENEPGRFDPVFISLKRTVRTPLPLLRRLSCHPLPLYGKMAP